MHAHDDSLVDWLTSLGYPDHTAARAAAQRLASPQLQPLWQLLQSRLLSPADSDKLEHALKQHSNKTVDPKLQRLQLKHQKLKQQVADCKQQICSEQARLQNWRAQAMQKAGQRQAEAVTVDSKYIKVLTSEVYVSSSERLKQLLTEVHRRLRDRQETPHRLSHSSGQQADQDGLAGKAEEATVGLADTLEAYIVKHRDSPVTLESLQIPLDGNAAVQDLIAAPPSVLTQAIADQTATARKTLQARTEASEGTGKTSLYMEQSQAGRSGIEAVLRARQEAHVKQFLDTEAAFQAGTVTQQQIQALQANADSTGSLQKQLQNTRADVAGAKAVIAVVEAQMAALRQEVQQCTDMKAELLHKWDQIKARQDSNEALDDITRLLFKQSLLQQPAWAAAAAQVRQLISNQLLPLLRQVKAAAAGLHDHMVCEQTALNQAALQQLGSQLAQDTTGQSQPLTTMKRFQRACQAASSAETVGDQSDGLLPVLQEATRSFPSAMVQSPDAFLTDIADRCQEATRCSSIMQQWSHSLQVAQTQAGSHAKHAAYLRQAASNMHDKTESESIPSLQATVKLCDEAAAFASKQVGTAMTEWWTQPAIHAVPWQKYEGRNAADWLAHVRAAHAAKPS